MSVKGIITTSVLISAVIGFYLTYAAAGNYVIGGHTITKFKDILHPFDGKFQSRSAGNKTNLLLGLWHLLFVVILAASSKQLMSLNKSLLEWIEKLTSPTQDNTNAAVGSSQNNQSDVNATSGAKSTTPLKSKSSSHKMIKSQSRSKSPPEKKKKKTTNVMQTSVIDPNNQLVQTVPRLSIQEDTSEKLNRLIVKFENMDTAEMADKKKK